MTDPPPPVDDDNPPEAAAPADSAPRPQGYYPPPPWPPPGEMLNTGAPAAVPPGGSGAWGTGAPWDPSAHGRRPGPGYASYPSQPYGYPGYQAPDPAVVHGPPWPRLVATGPYTPPPLIKWPVAVSAVVMLIVVVSWAIGGISVHIQSAWYITHQSTIRTLNSDQNRLVSDSPSRGGDGATWLDDWRRFNSDAEAAASGSSPPGGAAVPWREMINDYVSGSADMIQAVTNNDATLARQAQTELQAGDDAAHSFNQAMHLKAG